MPPGQPEPLEPVFHVVGDAGAVMIEGASNGMRTLTGAGFTHPDMVHWPVDDGVVGGALAASLHASLPPSSTTRRRRSASTRPRGGLVVDAMKRRSPAACRSISMRGSVK